MQSFWCTEEILTLKTYKMTFNRQVFFSARRPWVSCIAHCEGMIQAWLVDFLVSDRIRAKQLKFICAYEFASQRNFNYR